MNSGQGTTISLAAAVQAEASKQRPGRAPSQQPPHHQSPHPVQMPVGNMSNLMLNANTGSLSSSSSFSSFRGNSGQFFAMYNNGFDPTVRNSSSGFGYGVSPNIHDDINASGSAFSRNSSCFSAIDTNPGMFTNTSEIIHTPIPAEAPSAAVNFNIVPPVPQNFYEGDEDDEDDSYTQVSPVTVDNSPRYGSIGPAGVQPFVDVKVPLPQAHREEKKVEEVEEGERGKGKDEEVCEVVKFPVPLSEKDALKVFARSKFVDLRVAVEDRGNVLREGGEKYRTVRRAKALLDAGGSAREGLRPDPRALMAAIKISRATLEAKELLWKENMQQQQQQQQQQNRDSVPSFKYKKDGLAKLEQSIAHLGTVETKY